MKLLLCLVLAVSAASALSNNEHRTLIQLLERFLDKKNQPATCTAEYKKMKDSTMCINSENPSATNTGVSATDQTAIVNRINYWRSRVSPKASNMQKIDWDTKTAAVAQHWASCCDFRHDKNPSTAGYGFMSGQNIAKGTGQTWLDVIDGWHGEVKYFKFGYGSTTTGKDVGHYTQVVQALSAVVGCGYAECGGEQYFVCNFVQGQKDYTNPYLKNDNSCSGTCPGKCIENMCDCKGKLCLNGGTLDLSTCTCQCHTPLYTGNTCQQVNCPELNGASCNVDPPYGYVESQCNAENVKIECPAMCGLCPDKCPNTNVNFCKHDGNLDPNTCQCTCASGYKGARCDKFVNCPETVESMCSSYKAEQCDYITNLDQYCPLLCDAC